MAVLASDSRRSDKKTVPSISILPSNSDYGAVGAQREILVTEPHSVSRAETGVAKDPDERDLPSRATL